MTAERIATKAMKIAADLCIYTNHHTTIEKMEAREPQNDEVAEMLNKRTKEQGNEDEAER